MTPLREAAQQALEALEDVRPQNMGPLIHPAKQALRAALEQPEPEQVAQCSYPKCQTTAGCSGVCKHTPAPPQPEPAPCSTDPRAPHGFDRTASHTVGRYVCECEHWQPTPEPVAWIRVIDEAMVTHHLGVADPADDYETAKRKMNSLLCCAQDIGAYFAAPPQRSVRPHEQTEESMISNDDIKREFLAAGFTIKPGHDDLKPYVYDAARRVLALAGHGGSTAWRCDCGANLYIDGEGRPRSGRDWK